jgi:hypothetical protein
MVMQEEVKVIIVLSSNQNVLVYSAPTLPNQRYSNESRGL